MPRGARLDAPGALHHVMVRGIEKKAIVTDDEDRHLFVSRLGMAAIATGTRIYAWALMTNHAHLLLKSGHAGLSTFMRKFLTGYALLYNRRHQRHGYLFQNRYKSIICEEEPYFLKLVGYIHLNPLRAGLVHSLEELTRYPWSGHAGVMNSTSHEWQDRDYVLRYFAEQEEEAQRAYQEFLFGQSRVGAQPELAGGGLVRSAGGWSEVMALRRRGKKQRGDERVLGSGEFVAEILDETKETLKTLKPVSSRKAEALEALEKRCEAVGITLQALQNGSKLRECTQVRKELALKFVLELGLTYADTARLLGISDSAVNQIHRRNR